MTLLCHIIDKKLVVVAGQLRGQKKIETFVWDCDLMTELVARQCFF